MGSGRPSSGRGPALAGVATGPGPPRLATPLPARYSPGVNDGRAFGYVPTRRDALAFGLFLVLRAATDLARLLSDPSRYWNWEEAYNAGVAWYTWHAGLWDRLLDLQYKAFCGGCTVVSVVAAPVLGLGGDHLLLWKLVPLAWSLATMTVGWLAVGRHAGRGAAWTFAALFALPPLGFGDLGLMAWANHTEGLLFVFGALLLYEAGPPWALGLVLGLGLWFARSTVVAPLVVGVAAALGPGRTNRERVLLVAGFLVGVSPGWLPAAQGDWGYYDMSPQANLLPGGWGELMRRVTPLLTPEGLGARLYAGLMAMEPAAIGWGFGVVGALVVLAADGLGGRRRWLVPLMALGFLVAYGVSGFPVSQFRPRGPLLNMRYAGPWMGLLLATVAVSAGSWLSRGGWRRWVGALVVGFAWGPSLGAQVRVLLDARPTSEAWEAPAVHHHRFGWIATWRLDDTRLDAASSTDPATEAGLRRMRGYRAAARVHEGKGEWEVVVGELDALPSGGETALTAFAQALTDPIGGWAELSASNQRLAAMPPARARVIGEGMAWNLLFGVSSGAPPLPGTRPVPAMGGDRVALARARVEELGALARAGLAEGQPCAACLAVGPAALDVCRSTPVPEGVGACLAGAVQDLAEPDRDALLRGAGAICLRPGESRHFCERVADAAEGAGVPMAAFREGLSSPWAGVDRPFLLLDAGKNPDALPGVPSDLGPGGPSRRPR